jgi:hypothetical protein
MANQPSSVRQNYWAILVAAIACFVFEAGWYTIFLQPWLEGIGRSMQWMQTPGANNPPLQYGTALISAGLIAATISWIVQVTGEQTMVRGVKVAAMLWAGFVLTTFSTEYVFEVRPLSLYGVNEGFWLLGMAMMGAIVGGWKKKAKA